MNLVSTMFTLLLTAAVRLHSTCVASFRLHPLLADGRSKQSAL